MVQWSSTNMKRRNTWATWSNVVGAWIRCDGIFVIICDKHLHSVYLRISESELEMAYPILKMSPDPSCLREPRGQRKLSLAITTRQSVWTSNRMTTTSGTMAQAWPHHYPQVFHYLDLRMINNSLSKSELWEHTNTKICLQPRIVSQKNSQSQARGAHAAIKHDCHGKKKVGKMVLRPRYKMMISVNISIRNSVCIKPGLAFILEMLK